jgi:hypothetical protein
MNKSKWGVPVMPNNICSIDASTMSIAFAIFNTKEESLGAVGKINFEGKDTYEKGYGCWSKGKSIF